MSFDDIGNQMLGTCIERLGKKNGIILTYKADGFPFEAKAAFDKESVFLNDLGEAEVTSLSPRVGIRLSDFPRTPVKNDTVTLIDSGVLYSIVDVIFDSIGGATLVCHEVKECPVNVLK